MSWHQSARGLAGVIALLGCAWALAACSGGKEECVNRFDCPAEQVCQGGSCVAPSPTGSCVNDDECPRGEICLTRVCQPADGDEPDLGEEQDLAPADLREDTPDPPDLREDLPDLTGEDEPEDQEPPMLTMASPAPGQTQVSVQTNVTLTFSEPVRDFGIEFKVLLQDVDLNVEVPMTGRVQGNVITMDPMQDLRPGSPYQVIVTNEISDLAGNRLGDEQRWFFSTVIAEDEAHRALAMRYAPVVHQEIDRDRPTSDLFTRLDFDDNFVAEDNFDNFRDIELKSSAYYNILETESHYYIQYFFYYPAYFDQNITQNLYPHDVSVVQVVVRKAAEGAAEQLLLIESGYGVGGLFAFAAAEQGVQERNQGNVVYTFPAEELWRESHYRAYHGSNFHGSSHWGWAPGFQELSYAPWANHAPSSFNSPQHGIAFYPGVLRQGMMDLNCEVNDDAACAPELGVTCQEGTCRDGGGLRALSYDLLDFRSQLWVRRTDIDQNTRLFVSSRDAYSPHTNSGARPGQGEGRLFPVGFASLEENNRGGLPYGWSTAGSVSKGQWWLDPAWAISLRYRLEPNTGEVVNANVSLDYCFHPYFDIDRRGQAGCQ
jgi:hypothetical protein